MPTIQFRSRPPPARIVVDFIALVITIGAIGCQPAPVVGGTQGTLRAGGDLLSEMQITVHQHEGGVWQPVGFAVTADDGCFELVTNGAEGPLRLLPGNYCCTLESVGAPVQIPAEYLQATSTPLHVTWSAGEDRLNLDVPVPLLK